LKSRQKPFPEQMFAFLGDFPKQLTFETIAMVNLSDIPILVIGKPSIVLIGRGMREERKSP
jgi:hypothetical protein